MFLSYQQRIDMAQTAAHFELTTTNTRLVDRRGEAHAQLFALLVEIAQEIVPYPLPKVFSTASSVLRLLEPPTTFFYAVGSAGIRLSWDRDEAEEVLRQDGRLSEGRLFIVDLLYEDEIVVAMVSEDKTWRTLHVTDVTDDDDQH